jgi:hypothetical protein
LNALETAKQQGLKLPPVLVESSKGDKNNEKKTVDNDVKRKDAFMLLLLWQ